MSRTVRRQLIEISNTLRDANDLLEKLFQGVADEEMMELLTDCQNCAITMGNKIEAVYGSGLKSIHALENYCESIYQISQHLDSLSECMEIYEHTKKQLLEVRRDIEEIPDKKEIVFMPYKASMWDSLESVYLAAREDENCETYVIPIPYFDRKADKTLGEMHYEGEEYPVNIPITNWEKYNFEERQPDVIYIHNAYDDSNLVTCVHPRFFSGNLKKYTEKLVYIPYFVLEEIDPKDQVKIDAMKHFCFLPGIVNADRVILQSENMRQIYMNEYAKVVEAAGGTIDRKQLEEKFLGTGSPKFDKIMNTKKEDLDIPEEWLHIIKKPDGSWKKIIFYNTSVTALLQYNEKMLDKMRYVFNVFKQHQNEVALLWRPHPLIKTTIESMRPQLWEEYSKIVDQYREEGWGICDDSSDVDRAVILCDAYYGDQSSVVQLVQKTEKKILLEDVLVYNNKHYEKIFLNSMDAVLEKEVMWILSDYSNNLFEINRKSGRIENMYPIPYSDSRMYASCSFVKIEDKLYFAPYNTKDMWCFDLLNRKYEKIELGLSEDEKIIQAKYRSCMLYDKKILLVGEQLKELLLVDIESGKIKRYSGFIPELEKRRRNQKSEYFNENCIIYNGVVYFPILTSNSVMAFYIEEERYVIYDVADDCSDGYCSIDHKMNQFILVNWKDELIKWTPGEGVIYKSCLKFLTYTDKGYRTQLHSKDNTILFAGYENQIGIIDNHDKIVRKLSFQDSTNSYFKEGRCYMFRFVIQENNIIFFQTRIDGKIYQMDLNNDDKIEEMIINIPEKYIMKMLRYYWKNSSCKNVIIENEIMCINNYIELVNN